MGGYAFLMNSFDDKQRQMLELRLGGCTIDGGPFKYPGNLAIV